MAYYMDRFSAQVSRETMSLIPFYAKEMGDDVVKAAVDEAINNRARSWTYVKAILMAWQKEGIRNMDSLNRYMEERKKGAGRNANGGTTAAKGRRHLPGETVLE